MPAGAAAPAFGGARDAGLAERGESEAVRGHQKSTSWFGLPVSREDAPVEGERPASTTEGESDGLLGSVTRYLSGRSPQAPPEPPEWACGLTAMQRFQVAVGLGLASGLLFAMALFVFLPMVIFVPGKFALSFSIASVLLIMAVAFLRGPRKTLTGLVAREKAVFTAGYMLSLCLTLFATIVSPSYLLVIFSAGLQVIALAWFVASHIPGGVQGMTAMSGMVMRATTAMVMRGN